MQNDFHSLPKELAKGTEIFNLMMVLQKEYNLSLEEACRKGLRIHDTALAEFIELAATLPDFGENHQQVVRYIDCMGIMTQGVNTFYLTDTRRYLHGGIGFAWPEKSIKDRH